MSRPPRPWWRRQRGLRRRPLPRNPPLQCRRTFHVSAPKTHWSRARRRQCSTLATDSCSIFTERGNRLKSCFGDGFDNDESGRRELLECRLHRLPTRGDPHHTGICVSPCSSGQFQPTPMTNCDASHRNCSSLWVSPSCNLTDPENCFLLDRSCLQSYPDGTYPMSAWSRAASYAT